MTPVALTIAGSDPSGGAGIQADLKTFHQHRVYGEAVITLLTVQNTRGVTRVECIDPTLVAEQIAAVLSDIPPGAAKTGALGNAGVVEAVAAAIGATLLVVDPVMISKHGAPLIDDDAISALKTLLLPRALLLTPNLHEAAALAGIEVETKEQMIEAGLRLLDYGPVAVLIKGGHLEGTEPQASTSGQRQERLQQIPRAPSEPRPSGSGPSPTGTPDFQRRAADVLVTRDSITWFDAARITTPHTHGTGCTYSAAIAARLALGDALIEAVRGAKAFIAEAIRTNPGLGHGQGPINHFVAPSQALPR